MSIVRVDDGTIESSAGHLVAGSLLNGSAVSVRKAATLLPDADVAVVQHEYGTFGGPDGEEILDVVRGLRPRRRGVTHLVAFDQAYRSPAALTRFIAGSSVVVLAYESTDQAVELPSGGADLIVPHGDQAALTEAVGAATQDGVLLREMRAVLRRHARAPV